jgi:hypothetical protein
LAAHSTVSTAVFTPIDCWRQYAAVGVVAIARERCELIAV